MHFSTKLLFVSLIAAVAALFVTSALLFGQEIKTPFQKGVDAFKSGNYDEAIEDYTQAIQLNPQDANCYFQRSYVYMTKAEDDQAIADLTQAIQINPKFAQAYFRRAFVYMIKGRYDQAIQDLNQDVQFDSKNTKVYFRRANACMMNGAYDQALSDLNQVIQLDPTFTQAYAKRCFIYMLKGDYAGAISHLNEFIQSNPKNANPYNRLAWLLATCPNASFRDGRKAIELATTACDLTQWRIPGQLDTLAAAYAEAGDFASAVKWENEAISSGNNAAILDNEKSHLALFQSNRPYHVDKYVPQLDAVVN